MKAQRPIPNDEEEQGGAEQPTGLEEYLGQEVVIDTLSTFIFVGRLVRIDRSYLTLEAVDVHDTTDSSSTKDHYIMEAHKLGVRTNRGGVKVRSAVIISVSLLKDVETW